MPFIRAFKGKAMGSWDEEVERFRVLIIGLPPPNLLQILSSICKLLASLRWENLTHDFCDPFCESSFYENFFLFTTSFRAKQTRTDFSVPFEFSGVYSASTKFYFLIMHRIQDMEIGFAILKRRKLPNIRFPMLYKYLKLKKS